MGFLLTLTCSAHNIFFPFSHPLAHERFRTDVLFSAEAPRGSSARSPCGCPLHQQPGPGNSPAQRPRSARPRRPSRTSRRPAWPPLISQLGGNCVSAKASRALARRTCAGSSLLEAACWRRVAEVHRMPSGSPTTRGCCPEWALRAICYRWVCDKSQAHPEKTCATRLEEASMCPLAPLGRSVAPEAWSSLPDLLEKRHGKPHYDSGCGRTFGGVVDGLQLLLQKPSATICCGDLREK